MTNYPLTGRGYASEAHDLTSLVFILNAPYLIGQYNGNLQFNLPKYTRSYLLYVYQIRYPFVKENRLSPDCRGASGRSGWTSTGTQSLFQSLNYLTVDSQVRAATARASVTAQPAARTTIRAKITYLTLISSKRRLMK